jgi:hypothetical protein
MSTDAHEERLAGRVADLYATDQQFADARPQPGTTPNPGNDTAPHDSEQS